MGSVPWWLLFLGYLRSLALNFSRKSKHQEEYLWYRCRYLSTLGNLSPVLETPGAVTCPSCGGTKEPAPCLRFQNDAGCMELPVFITHELRKSERIPFTEPECAHETAVVDGGGDQMFPHSQVAPAPWPIAPVRGGVFPRATCKSQNLTFH